MSRRRTAFGFTLLRQDATWFAPGRNGNRYGGFRSDTPPRTVGAGSFTLLELLLVLAIIGIVSAVTLPSLVGSMRGSRLRFAARTVVMAGRYARSMAVMKQSEMILRFDLDGGKISVAAAGYEPAPIEAEETPDETEGGGELATIKKPAQAPAGGAVELARALDGVAIKRVEIQSPEGESFTSGGCAVIYRTNGTCTPYKVEIEDDNGLIVKIKVDSLSSAETESGKK